MKLTREHIVVFAVFVIVLAALGSVYQFYYVPRLQIYRENLARRDDLEAALSRIESTFSSTDPKAVIQAVKDQIQPLTEELNRRAEFFRLDDINAIDPIPENKILRIYYTEQYNKMMNELRQDAYSKNIYIPDPLVFMGAPQPAEVAGRSMSVEEVQRSLKTVKMGCSMVRFLMQAKAPYIMDVVLWPARLDPAYEKLLYTFTTGFHFYMTYPDLVAFLEKLRLSDRYFAVNALSLQNKYLRTPTEPLLEIRFLLTQAAFQPPQPAAAPGPQGPVAATSPAPFSSEQRLADARILRSGLGARRATQPPPTRLQRIWRWFDKYVWPFN